GAWYLWALPLVAFFVSGRWRAGGWLACCWGAGTIGAALLTGKPLVFLKQALLIAAAISKEQVPQWALVGEFRPSYGEFATAALVAIVILWRRQEIGGFTRVTPEAPLNRRATKAQCSSFSQTVMGGPVFWVMVICWILGFKADRFWADWGMPAVLVWLTLQIQDSIAKVWSSESWKRLLICGVLALPLFLHATNDLDRRYSGSLNET